MPFQIMKQRGIAILTIVTLLVVPVTLCAWGFLLPACFSETFMGELPEKVRLLDETEGRRIIVVGGSAAAFGIDSDVLRREMEGYEVVNFGMYAGLGTGAMLNLSRGSLREGDIVIVMPEQQEQSLSDYFGAEYFWQAADGHFGLLARLSRDEVMGAVGAFPAFAAEKFGYVSRGHLPEPDNVYRKGAFGDNGDIREGIAVGNRMAGGFDVNTPIRFETEMVGEEFADLLNEYAERAAGRGAKVYYHFPPMNAGACELGAGAESTDAILDDYTGYLAGGLICPILGDPRDAVMDSEYFFDTNFHLTDAGRAIFTRQVVRDLKAELGISAKTEPGDSDETEPGVFEGTEPGISDETEPGISNKTEPENAETDSPPDGSANIETIEDDFFCYTIEDGVVRLTGLTDSGEDLTSLTVPSEIEGYAVEMIAAAAFAGQEQLEKITIPASVGMIEDYAFDGCTALREIVMESGEPERCIVGRHLLDGTGARVVVPETALSAYRLNYNWSVWAERIAAR